MCDNGVIHEKSGLGMRLSMLGLVALGGGIEIYDESLLVRVLQGIDVYGCFEVSTWSETALGGAMGATGLGMGASAERTGMEKAAA